MWGTWTEKHDIRETTQHGKARTTDRFYGQPSRRFDGNHQKHTSGQFCQLCGAWRGSLGLEPDPDLYVSHLLEIFREVRRVLRKDGTGWLNISDSYAGSGKGIGSAPDPKWPGARNDGMKHKTNWAVVNLKPKDMVLIPFRLALALQAEGWYVRSDIIWHKPNCMPSSVRDRPTSDFEHLFLLARTQKYFYDQDSIREPIKTEEKRASGMETQGRQWRNNVHRKYKGKDGYGGQGSSFAGHTGYFKADGTALSHPLGRNKRTVWKIPTSPFPGAHFAVFPEKLVEPMVLAGSSPKACPHCRAPWKSSTEKTTTFQGGSGKAGRTPDEVNSSGKWAGKQYGDNIKLGPVLSVERKGWRPTCDCPDNDGSGKCIVLDPFAGSGTTCVVAEKHDRAWIGIEQNPDYCNLAEKRIEETEKELDWERKQLKLGFV